MSSDTSYKMQGLCSIAIKGILDPRITEQMRFHPSQAVRWEELGAQPGMCEAPGLIPCPRMGMFERRMLGLRVVCKCVGAPEGLAIYLVF